MCKWIPLYKKFPENNEHILMTVKIDSKKYITSGHYYKGGFTTEDGNMWFITENKVIAWMPFLKSLPEPYNEDEIIDEGSWGDINIGRSEIIKKVMKI